MYHLTKGLFLQLSNINHDCNPNCTIYFKGNTVYLKALQDIPENEEVSNYNNYIIIIIIVIIITN